MKHLLAIRHIAFEDLGIFEPMFEQWGYRIEYVDAPTCDLTRVDVIGPDLLVLLGGPVSVYDEAIYPFLTHELALTRQRLESGRALLGICLGAQMIAHACGARVYSGPAKEIGWAPVTLTDAGSDSALAPLGEGEPVLHWHGDTFDLPEGAICLASTNIYQQQAFSIGTQVLGLQFHLEVSSASLESWLVGHAVELAVAKVDVNALRKTPSSSLDVPRLVLQNWMDGLASGQR